MRSQIAESETFFAGVRRLLNHVHYVVTGGGSWLDHPEVVVKDWEHMFVGGAHDVDGMWARQA